MTNRRVLIITPLFPPEIMPAAAIMRDYADGLTRLGYHVEVLTNLPNRPAGIVFPDWKEQCADSEYPFEIIRVYSVYLRNRKSAFWKMLENIAFGIRVAFWLLSSRRQYIYCLSLPWPAVAAALIAVALKVRGVRSAYFVMDLLPEQAEQSGVCAKAGMISKIIVYIDRVACRLSSRLFLLSTNFIEAVTRRRRISLDKIKILPLHYNHRTSDLLQSVSRAEFRRKNNIDSDALLVLFSGTMGRVSGVDIICDIIPMIAGTKIVFVCIGEGYYKEELLLFQNQYPSNLRVLSFLEQEAHAEALTDADICFLPLRADCAFGSLPSKLLSYMLANKKVLSNAPVESESYKILHESAAGIFFSSAVEAVTKLRNFQKNNYLQDNYIRTYVCAHFSLDRCLSILDNDIKDAEL